MIVQHLGVDYRLTPEGRIECRGRSGRWVRSTYSDVTEDEIPWYERKNHPLLPLLRQKFGLNNDTPMETTA